MESRVKRENYILISGWMVTDLHLKGNELVIFAMIHGFSQDGVGAFSGSLQYISDWTNLSKQGVQNVLKSLILKGYISKKDKIINNVKYCEYSISEGIQKTCMVCKKVDEGMQKSCMGYAKNLHGGIQKICTNNKYINTNNNKNNNISATADSASSDFERLWSIYPNKKGSKSAAFKSYQKAIKNGVTNEVIEQGIKNLIADIRANKTEIRFVPHGSTWFNQERWNDSYQKNNSKPDYDNGGENILETLEEFI